MKSWTANVALACTLIFGTVGCSTLSKANDVLTWANTKFAEVDQTISSVKEKYDEKIASIEKKQIEDMAGLEAKVGYAIDSDQNGKVDLEEAKQVYVDLIQGAISGDAEKKEALLDPTTLMTLLMALLGIGGVGGGVALRRGNKKDVEVAVAKAVNGNGGSAKT